MESYLNINFSVLTAIIALYHVECLSSCNLLFAVDHGEEVLPQNSSNGNVWKERLEFYHSAQPKNEEEEDLMMRRALQESQKLEQERQQQILEETACQVRLLYAFLFIFI